VQFWTYPKEDELRAAFEAAILSVGISSTRAMLAPDPGAMLQAIANQSGSIGYAPRSWLKGGSNSVRVIELDSKLEEKLRLPVLAISSKEPAGAVRTLLLCLQGKNGRSFLEGIYEPWK
jgi:hypothetical protein